MEQNFCVHCMNSTSDDICGVCGKNKKEYQPAPHHLQPGTILGGKYVVGAVLGEGGFGITYIGREINLDIKVAIKEYFPSGVVNRNNTSSTEISAHVGDAQAFFEKGKSSFLGEARTLAKFSNEASIVSVRDFFSENNTAYIVMEYLEGIDLKDYIKQHGKMSFEQTVAMLTPVMRALSKIHAQGLIHRDISPANIMILNDGTVKLLDFGAAREVGGADEKSLSILLKPGFAPEEQYRTKGHQGPWTDVYALSATMYKMMTGLTPIDAMNRVFSDDLRRITELNPGVTPEQEAIILKGMAVQQENRYQTIDELCADCQTGSVKEQPVEKTVGTASDNSNWMNAWGNSQEQTQNQSGEATNSQAIKGDKKPNIAAFVGSIITGFLSLYFILNTASQIIDEENVIFSLIMTLLFGVATFFLGRLYFPRIDNKKRKPNVFCLVANILSSLLTIFCAWLTYVNFTDVWAEEGTGEFGVVLTVLSLALPIFFGYFYYPRLERKKKSLVAKIYSGIAAGAVAIFAIGIIFTSVNTITIGDQNIERDATHVSLTLDIVTNNDIAKLKELKNLESLEVFECFLDDEDIKTLGELTQLKKLSISTNTDVTDISPLSNLTELTYLNISNTKVSDISCIANLVKLETLDINNTKVSDLSALTNFTVLDTLKMDSIEGLDVSTITLPATVRTLYCNSNELESLDFVSGSESLANIYASNNKIGSLSPLSKYKLNIIHLAANNITDLSPLNVTAISDLDVSTNAISDISCLKGIPAFQLDLGYNQITDISALTENYQIGMVDLNNNQITDINPLKDCFKIYSLDISYNQIVDISAIATIDAMEHFNARGNKIVDITPLASCTKFIESGNTIDLRDNQIVSVDALSKYTKVTHIYLSGNKITDVSPLQYCVALEMLKINDNQIADVSALGSLPELYILELVNNPITSLDAFGLAGHENSLLGNSVLRITYNEGIDFARLAEIEKLVVTVYDVPPRQQETIRGYGFNAYQDYSGDLDEIEENDDLVEDESTEEETNG
ncbi:leucine-rich repeat domain-containing protein [Anaeromassilibacillus sp. 1001302B_160321_C8]|uniref:leucine-rich repeat domain-containing protein n=1 Tax=Anaeromassilibacillus sp. 1001302B_160321_C8 TaxID=2787132 RepID=UPI0018990F29|nr:leucine-rich repeat domain-containing protein [Anaeromassilibacillus sp. 1001302B_160321_C8]